MNKLTLDTLAAARTWLQTEPGDHVADVVFKTALVRAGFLKSVDQIIGLVCGQEDDTTVQIVTETHVYTLDTLTNVVVISELPPGFALAPCPLCKNLLLNHHKPCNGD